tara:strand:+ start:519 stop:1040 length:522 start_codon:yes stop_codon:yes gene_type:complete
MSNIRFINKTIVSSTVASVSVTDVFTTDFDIYQITLDDGNSSANANVDLRFINSSGSIIASSSYDYAHYIQTDYGGYVESIGVGSTFLEDIGGMGRSTENQNGGNQFYIFNPTDSTSYTFFAGEASKNATSGSANQKGVGILKQFDNITGFYLQLATGNITNLNINVYGIRKD